MNDNRADMGNYCKNFREVYLNVPLLQLAKQFNVSYKAVWAFENGKSTNLEHIIMYYKACNGNKVLEREFTGGLFQWL